MPKEKNGTVTVEVSTTSTTWSIDGVARWEVDPVGRDLNLHGPDGNRIATFRDWQSVIVAD